ncbi:MAG TPA: phospholipase [Myxococcales bacterium]|nr:phospholipase [Myxococcales bacterium]
MRVHQATLGGLRCTVAQISDEPPGLLVVLCHGFGAPGDDLVLLAPELCDLRPELERARFLFPEAPLSLGWSGMGDARAWWMIDLEGMDRARREGPEAMARIRAAVPDGLPRVRRMLRACLDEACLQVGLPLSAAVLGGFSQGAMLATDVALRLEEPPAGLCILSGTLICEPEWRRLAPARAGLPVLQTHGRLDDLLPFEGAEALRDLLAGAGLPVDFHAFDGAHGIPREVKGPWADFLAARVPAP